MIKKKLYSYVLMDVDGEWVLTFLLGGPVELDVSVKLTDSEVEAIKSEDAAADRLVSEFKKDKSLYENRKIVPTIWPSKPR
ncbi:hypothetical protein QQM79_03435 [Marinobacteraceae bacterium S3BR75-40.1]